MKCLLLLLFSATVLSSQTRMVPVLTSGISFPVFATHAPGQDDLVYIVEKGGAIKVLDRATGALAPNPVHTFSGLRTSGEAGFLGLTFHPDFETNGYAYCYTSIPKSGSGINHETLIRRLTFSSPTTVTANSDTVVMRFNQPFGNHNAGWMGFGPDGYLYIAVGDGGSGNDPGNRGQSKTTLLGKMLRIDVDADDFPSDANKNYGIPATNPFVGVTGLDEIWAYGLRNPWRCSFDRETGDFYIGDVGQGLREEIDVQKASSAGGENYGWRLREGFIATPGSVGGNKPADNVDPVHDYDPGGRASVTGGYVYRGPSPSLQGQYFFADYESAQLWSMVVDVTGTEPVMVPNSLNEWTNPLITDTENEFFALSSFGEDADGNLYVVEITGDLYVIVAEPREPAISSVSVSGAVVTLMADQLTPDTTNTLQRTKTPGVPESWEDRGSFTTLAGRKEMTDSLPAGVEPYFYRISSEAAE